PTRLDGAHARRLARSGPPRWHRSAAGRRSPDTSSALHEIDVVNRNRLSIAEIDHENGKPDGGFRRRHREHQQREDLPDQIAEKARERDQVDVDREQDQLDRHQDDDHVLAVEEDAEDSKCEQDRGDGEVVAKRDGHDSPCPDRTLTISIAVAFVRATWWAMFWRLIFSRCRSVRTIAPIMATRSTRPAAWKK